MRAWVRDAGHRTGGWLRSAGPYGILAFMAASAVAPIAGSSLGAAGEYAAALDQLGGMGSNYLADAMADTAEKLRGRAVSERRWRELLADELRPLLEADDARARALRAEIGRLLRELDAVGTALAASADAGDGLREALAEAFHTLGADVGELRWMLADARQALDDLRRQLAAQGLRHHQELELIRQQLVTVSQLRQGPLGEVDPAPRVDPTPDGPAGPAANGDGASPYPGLASFQPADARWFAGREDQVAELLARLAEQVVGAPPLAVVGVSGVGKSSLLRAGLLPAIAAGGLGTEAVGWPWLLLTPGPDPLAELVERTAALAADGAPGLAAAANAAPGRYGELVARVARDGRRPVIVVDQLEELFTQCPDPARRLAFATALTDAAPALVVFAVRADFYPACTQLAPLADVLAAGHVVLGPLRPDQLRRAVTEPARRAGLELADGLVELLLRDLGAGASGPSARAGSAYDPGALPLLGHALRAVWARREGRRLTVAGYRATGGIHHAVAETAERIYLDLDADGRRRLRGGLLGLIAVADGGVLVRRRGEPGAIDPEVLDRLVAARLVTAGRDVVELSHEALLTSWPRLAGWLAEAREEILLRQRLDAAARDWRSAGEDPDLLLRGARLAAAREWAAGRDDVGEGRSRYLAASAAAAEAAEASRRRGARRLRRLAAGLATALVLAVAGGLVALDRQADAEARGREALSRQYAAESLTLATSDQLGSMRRALDAWHEAPTVEAYGALASAQMTNTVGHLGTLAGGQSVAVSPDGSLVAVGHPDGRIRLWDTATLRERPTPLVHQDGETVFSVAFSPDGRYLAAGALARDGLRVWDVATGRLTHTLPGLGAVAWLPGTRTVLASRADTDELPERHIGGWDAGTGRRVLTIPAGEIIGFDLDVSPDGRYVAAAVGEPGGAVWRAADGRRVATLPGAQTLAFVDDAIVTSDQNGWMRAWAVPSGRELRALTAEGDLRPPSRLAATPSGFVLAAGSEPAQVGAWLADRGGESTGYVGFAGNIADIALSADGKTVVVTGTNAPSAVFRRAHDWLTHTGVTLHLAIDRAGRRLATTTSDGLVAVWDLMERERVVDFRPAGGPAQVAYAPGGTLAVTTAAGTVELRDPAGRLLRTLPVGEGTAHAVAFSPDGSLLAAALEPPDDEAPRTVVVWRTDGWRRLGEVGTGTYDAAALLFTPAGDRLIAATSVGDVINRRISFRSGVWAWRTADLAPVDRYDVGPYQVTDAALSPDGTRLAVVGADRHIDLLPLDGSARTRVAAHPSTVRSVAFSPDGRTLATSTVYDAFAWLWDARTGALRARLTGHVNALNAVAFAPDGTLATASADATVGLWQLDPAEAVDRVCRIVAPADRAAGREPPAAC